MTPPTDVMEIARRRWVAARERWIGALNAGSDPELTHGEMKRAERDYAPSQPAGVTTALFGR